MISWLLGRKEDEPDSEGLIHFKNPIFDSLNIEVVE